MFTLLILGIVFSSSSYFGSDFVERKNLLGVILTPLNVTQDYLNGQRNMYKYIDGFNKLLDRL